MMKMKKALLIILILFSSCFQFAFCATDEGYGEDQTSLGQFVDSFENANNITVIEDLIVNATLDCVELNYTIGTGWMNNSWAYRRNHTIENATGANSDYQVNITVHYGAGTNNDNDVYLNSSCQPDFDDIRFTESNGVTELNYTMLNKVDSSQALFYIKISDNLTIDNSIIYIYYNSSGVTTTSNGTNTFLFYDDFPGVNLDLSKWNGDTGSASIAGGLMTLTGADAWKRIYSKVEYTIPFAITAKAQMEGGYRNMIGVRDPVSADYCDIAFGSVIGNSEVRSFKAGASTVAASNVATTEEVFVITMNTSMVSYYEDSTELTGSPLGSNIPIVDMPMMFYVWEGDGTKDIIVDYCFIHKFIGPEPKHGSWGSEELTTSGYANYGYFITDDYLNDTDCNGSSLALMVNASIPANTDIQVQFSNDNVTWGDWEGIPLDSNMLSGGFETIDLRYLNYTDIFFMFNFSTTDGAVTPRLYQARLISTIGVGGAGPSGGGGIGIIMLILICTPLIILLGWGLKKR